MRVHEASLRYVDWLLAHALKLRESGDCDDAEKLEQRAMLYLDEAAGDERSSIRSAATGQSGEESTLMTSAPR